MWERGVTGPMTEWHCRVCGYRLGRHTPLPDGVVIELFCPRCVRRDRRGGAGVDSQRLETTPCYFTPEKVSYHFRNWAHLCALAENPATARGLLERGPTRESPKAGARQQGYRGDSLNWACVKADLERAWRALDRGPEGSMQWLGHQAIWGATRRKSPGMYAAEIHRRKSDVIEAFEAACETMARYLGWVEEEA